MNTHTQTIVSGIRPTGKLHLGNYFGAISLFLHLQKQYRCFFFVADWHALTTHTDTKSIRAQSREVLAYLLACGLDPEKCAIYTQSAVPEVCELYLYLNMVCYLGELEKTPSFKEKARSQPQNVNAGLLTYPSLMAADILAHNAQMVPVGKDQLQHLEMVRHISERFNTRYGPIFTTPQAFHWSKGAVKIQSLDGKGKMSKSENENATIYLQDTDEQIRAKIRKAKTDSAPAGTPLSENMQNLFNLLGFLDPKAQQEQMRLHESSTLQYGAFKEVFADATIRLIAPIREKAHQLLNEPDHLETILKQGADKARASAQNTLRAVRVQLHF